MNAKNKMRGNAISMQKIEAGAIERGFAELLWEPSFPLTPAISPDGGEGEYKKVALPKRGRGAFTLIEVLLAMALMAVILPVIFSGMHIASLAGEVSERKALAIRIGDRVLNENVLATQLGATAAASGQEMAGPYQFNWTVKDDAWNEVGTLATLTTANGVNQAVVSSSILHQLTVEVNYTAQGNKYSVQVATIVNKTPPQ